MNRPGAAETESLTQLLHRWRSGDGNVYDAIISQAYDELRRIAHQRMNRVGGLSGMSATDLLHEALIKIGGEPKDWQTRAHFFASISLTLRSVLVDFSREQQAEKRGGDFVAITFTESNLGDGPAQYTAVLDIDHELSALELLDPRASEILHLVYFANLTREEVAAVMKISIPTVDRELRFARGWLKAALQAKRAALDT